MLFWIVYKFKIGPEYFRIQNMNTSENIGQLNYGLKFKYYISLQVNSNEVSLDSK